MGGDSKAEDALALYDQGRAAMARGDHALAVAKLEASVALSPTAPSLASLGESLFRLSRYTEAVVHLAAAIGLGDTRLAVRTMLAGALYEKGDLDEAVRILNDALKEHPEDEGMRSELRRALAGPVESARKANRYRLINELRTAGPSASESLVKSLDLLGIQDLGEVLSTVLPELAFPQESTLGIGPALGRYYVDAVAEGAPEADLTGRLLSRMAESDDSEVRGVFDDALAKIVDAGSPSVIEAARRAFGGSARRALENLA